MISPLATAKAGLSAGSLESQSQGSHFGDISGLIQQKEAELRGIHEMRCTQLEGMVTERDALLLESSKRFNQLKDDFQYNLALLDARDKEIQRVEGIAETCNTRIKELDLEKKSLLQKIEHLVQQDNDRIVAFEQEKGNNKKRLLQLKEEIEHTVWTSGETVKAKERDITSLRVELTRAKAEYDDQIESQRKDLTKTFELLMHQREDVFKEKERQIGGQIDTLSHKFEHLKNENTRLKTEGMEQKRRADLLQEENALKDENYRKLIWKMDDERAAMQRSEDAFQVNLQQLTMQISEAKAEADKAGAEGQRLIEQARADSQREKELRHAVERSIEDMRRTFFDEETRYQRDLSESRNREEGLLIENTSLKKERDDALDRHSRSKADMDAMELRHRGMTRELASLKDELHVTSRRLEETEAKLIAQTVQAEEDRQASIKALELSESRARDEMFAFRDDAQRIQDRLREDFERSRSQLICEHEDTSRESSRVYEEKISVLTHKLEESAGEITRLRTNLSERDHELSEEKAEAAALKLRIRLHESQATASQEQIERLQRHVSQSISSPVYQRSRVGSDSDSVSGARNGRPPYVPSARRMSVPESPIFSEDFGPASVPLSPEPTPSRRFSFEHKQTAYSSHAHTSYPGMSPSNGGPSSQGVYSSGYVKASSQSPERLRSRAPSVVLTTPEPVSSPLTVEDPLVAENERLKTIIKDVSSYLQHDDMKLFSYNI